MKNFKQHLEEGLRDWFGNSKSKDGKKGWVNVVTGGTCASDEPGEGVPKCVSSEKRASMTKAERESASRRKKAADPGQQSKSGAAKPTNVKTMNEESDKKSKGSGTKDACYSKVKSRYSVWPSAYASGALVKCRKVGAANWGNKSVKEELAINNFKQFLKEAEDWKDQKMYSDVTNKVYKVADIYAWAKNNTKQVTTDIKNTDALEWWHKQYDMDNKAHKKRMMDADTSYPILGIRQEDGTISVADGLNRVKKAHTIEKKKTVPAYVINQKDLENIDGQER